MSGTTPRQEVWVQQGHDPEAASAKDLCSLETIITSQPPAPRGGPLFALRAALQVEPSTELFKQRSIGKISISIPYRLNSIEKAYQECFNQVTPLGGLTNLRQESLDAIAFTELVRTKTLNGSQTLFNDVLEQLNAKEESLPTQAALYTLPSMQFLENLLDEMDNRSTSAGCVPAEPPMYLPIDSIDIPGLETSGSAAKDMEELGLSPMPKRSQSSCQQPTQVQVGGGIENLQRQVPSSGPSPGPSPGPHQRRPPLNTAFAYFVAPTAGSAAASPAKAWVPPSSLQRERSGKFPSAFSAVIPQASIQREMNDVIRRDQVDEMQRAYSMASMQSMKNRKPTKSFSGLSGSKRKLGDSNQQAGSTVLLNVSNSEQMTHCMDSGDSISLAGEDFEDADEEETYSRNERKNPKKGTQRRSSSKKITICLNCGSSQTPQWRCGPLGPRTLCNACGVRYKKGLPLNCWPLRDGMVLPPGASLPPSVQVPAGMTIITQPQV